MLHPSYWLLFLKKKKKLWSYCLQSNEKSANNAFQGTGYHCGFPKVSLSNLLLGFTQVGCCKIASP
jgi:hypothetical protein